MADIIALVLSVVLMGLIPCLLVIGIYFKHPMERKGLLICFFTGLVSYIVLQWGVKQHGFMYISEMKWFSRFIEAHYLLYLLLVALVGAMLMLFAIWMIANVIFKRQMSYSKAVVLGLGYTIAEAMTVAGVKNIQVIISVIKGNALDTKTSTLELYLAGYERVLILLIHVAIVVAFVYFMELKMPIRGGFLVTICNSLVAFLPGFFLAFTTRRFYEVYDKNFGFVLIYFALTAFAIGGIIVLYALRYSLKDENVDSRQAVAAYQKLQEEKSAKKRVKKTKKHLS